MCIVTLTAYGKILLPYGSRKWQHTPILLPGKPNGLRSLRAIVHGVTESQIQLSDRTIAIISISISSVAQSCATLGSRPGLPVHHQLPESTQTHVLWVSDAIQSSHPLPSPSPPALSLSQHQGLFQWVSSSHQVAKVLEFQLQHQSFQWTPRTDLL